MNTGQAVEIRRRVESTRGRVWRAITDKALVASWWGPETFTTYIEEWDLRFGGRFRARMTSTEGNVLRIDGHFNQVDQGRTLGFTWHSDMDAGRQSRVIISLAGDGAVTEVRLVHDGLADADAVEVYQWAWTGALDGLEQVVRI